MTARRLTATALAALLPLAAAATPGSTFWAYYDRPDCTAWPPQILKAPDRALKPVRWADRPVQVRVLRETAGARGAPFFEVEIDGGQTGYIWAPVLPAPQPTQNQFTLRESCVLTESPDEVAATLAGRASVMGGAERAATDAAAREARERSILAAAAAKRLEQVIAQPAPAIGMDCAVAYSGTNWGTPVKVNRIENALGVIEQWVFENNRYLYCRNGRLSEIQVF